ncbi:MAG: hypothetical protein JOZ04_11945 [Acidimicrobiia bacterium]|nr:hypothetical protein [Acidimicrobiia bacterium]
MTAPAGYGKTVLIDQWVDAHDGPPVATVTLQGDDSWPAVAARIDAALPSTGPAILVLDAVDAPADDALARELAALIAHAPANLHLVLVSRSRAVPALHSLHGRRDVASLTTADLAFTRGETRAVVKAVAAVALSDTAVSDLLARTEGWAVGLEVAAIGLRDAAEGEPAIEALAGDERHVAAFLSDVLADQAPATRGFLMQTSVLDKLNGALCDALTGGDGGAVTLRGLERAGVFMRRIHGSREWFTCHRLFREFLRAELHRQEFGDEDVLLVRAAAWHAARGDAEAAAGYYADAGAWSAVVELSDAFGQEMFQRGRARDVEAWLDAIPGTYAQHGTVALRRAYLHTMVGEPRRAAQLEHDLAIADISAGERAAADAVRSTLAFFDAAPREAIRAAEDALHAMEELDPAELPNIFGATSPTTLAMMAGTSRARALWYLGDVVASRRALSAGIAQRDAYSPWLVRTVSALALLEAWAGNLGAAQAHGRRASGAGASTELLQYPAGLEARIALAHVSRDRGHQRRAADLLAEATSMASHGHRPVTDAILAVEHGLWALAAGQAERGLRQLQQWRALTESRLPPIVEAYLRATEARLHLCLGDVERAETMADRASLRALCPELVAVGVQAALNRHDADAAVARLDAWPLADGHERHRLQHRLWTAVVQLETGDRRRAVHGAVAVVGAAEREGDVRLFLDGGRAVERLVRALLHAGPHPFAERILRAARAGSPPSGADALALSRRELEVARYLPTPLSSAEIAERLFISLNTLKTHLRTIYSKLGATNRREAIQRAEELGIA